MTTEEMAEKIFETVVMLGPGCSFVEIQQHCGEEARGDFQFSLPGYQNVILWAGVSEMFVTALHSIREKLHLRPTGFLVYAMDGEMLRMPIAKTFRAYKAPRWLPVVFGVRDEAKPTAEEWEAISRRFFGTGEPLLNEITERDETLRSDAINAHVAEGAAAFAEQDETPQAATL
jgi:hypothetical protein